MQNKVDCPETFLHALDYSQVAGLFAGMICLGLIVDQIGRKWGSVTTASIMFVGKPPCSSQLDSACCPPQQYNSDAESSRLLFVSTPDVCAHEPSAFVPSRDSQPLQVAIMGFHCAAGLMCCLLLMQPAFC